MYWHILVLCCGIIGGIGQLLFKSGVDPINIVRIGLGFVLYGAAFVLYLIGLRHLQVSVAYPLIAVSYIVVALGSVWYLGESLSLAKVIGTIGLILSISVIAQ